MDAQTFLIPNFTYNGQVIENRVSPKNFCKNDFQAPDAHFWVGEGSRPGPEVFDLSTKSFHSQISFIFISVNLVPPYIHLIFSLFPNLVHSIVFPSYLSSHLNINSQGSFVADENGSNEPLRKYSQKTLVIVLPGDLTVFDIGE